MNLFLKILSSFLFILLLFFLVIIINWKLSEEVNHNTQWLTTSEQVIKNSNRIQRNIIDMESAFRGYLLLSDSNLLVPFAVAQQELPELYKEIRGLLSESSQITTIDSIEGLQKKWEEFAIKMIGAKKNAMVADTAEATFIRLFRREIKTKTYAHISNEIRQNFKELNAYEYNLRSVRRDRLNASVSKSNKASTLLIVISTIGGLCMAFYLGRHISVRVNNMVNLSEKISQGDFNISLDNNTHDEIGRLATSLNIMANKLNENFTELQNKNKELDQFAYVVSHDLKAPLRGLDNISGWIKEDIENNQKEKIKGYLDMMAGRVKRMENLINGILDLARVGRSKQDYEMVHVGLLLKDCIELLSPPPKFKFEISAMPSLITPKTYLQQVFSNLISNAIKYHDKENGVITISQKDLGDYYEFSVKEDGPGIAPIFHSKIFVIFQTLKERDAFESTGVGLAIVKKIIDQVKGTIKVKSDIGLGAEFVFTWPKIIKYQYEL